MVTLQREDIARHVAAQLASEFDPTLPEAVEKELERARQQKLSPSYDESVEVAALGVAIAALLVQVASFAVQIYDFFRQDSRPLPEEEEYMLMVQEKIGMEVLDSASPEKRKQIKRIIKVVVLEIIEQEDS
ncbi:hypothetical protein [Nostoc sp. NMS8]|uniref:hypothetical protein n=1 Tax=Nostoc sp. NMS8 TaxID=2815392 RepID=UPI0026007CAD|nr:hypothetical protein [Nostoc sp. NMS8]MBN3961774.1 hypothetical protein [Nostoc sp. NMS8]